MAYSVRKDATSVRETAVVPLAAVKLVDVVPRHVLSALVGGLVTPRGCGF